MRQWLTRLSDDLSRRRASSLHRQLRPLDRPGPVVRRGRQPLINLASNDYLGLSQHPRLREAVADAAREFGVGAGASRLVAGHLQLHQQLEQRLAVFKHAPAALVTPTGYMANLAAVTALADARDAIFLDKLNHASLIDAARASGAAVRTFPHRNIDKLHRLLGRYGDARRRLILTDTVFSMDGDAADLPRLCEVRDRYSAVLLIDEAHATGVLGATGAGLAEAQGVAGEIDVTVSTASKALGSLGGFISADAVVIETLINHARAFIYTTAIPPTTAAAILAALDVLRDEPERRAKLANMSRTLRRALRQHGWQIDETGPATPIIPLIVGTPSGAIDLAARLEHAGFLAPAIRTPTVPGGTDRVRLSLRADLTDEHLARLIDAVGPPPASAR
ncbi:MAG: 8-amino-7-oxononanoate synthase [Phycisphaeraceae bacterium]